MSCNYSGVDRWTHYFQYCKIFMWGHDCLLWCVQILHDEVQIVVRFLLGNSLAYKFYVPTLRNALSCLHRQAGMKNDWV